MSAAVGCCSMFLFQGFATCHMPICTAVNDHHRAREIIETPLGEKKNALLEANGPLCVSRLFVWRMI